MALDAQKDLIWLWGQLWTTLAVSMLIYGGDVTSERLWRTLVPATREVFGGKEPDSLPMYFRVWYATRAAHPLVAGALASLLPIPHPVWVASPVTAMIWFALAGMGNGQVHLLVDGLTEQTQKIVGLLADWVRRRLGLRSSEPPREDRDR